MPDSSATAISNPNIAFIKYWGNRDQALGLPANGSISMNLAGLETLTEVRFDPDLPGDVLKLNGRTLKGPAFQRVSAMLERVRGLSGLQHFALVSSQNNFPMGAGMASSASAFSALAVAASAAAELELTEAELSRLARSGSGSACRSVPGGFVEWQAGSDDSDSYAYSIAPPEYWDLVDCIAVISSAHKPIGSKEGHTLAASSPLQAARLADAPRRLDVCRKAILERDFTLFAEIVELDSNMMHAVMMTSTPRLFYWRPGTLAVMRAVQDWRKNGLPVCFTIDAGPNVHVMCLGPVVEQVKQRLLGTPGVEQVLVARAGGPARVVTATV